jgi:hypothetical protein
MPFCTQDFREMNKHLRTDILAHVGSRVIVTAESGHGFEATVTLLVKSEQFWHLSRQKVLADPQLFLDVIIIAGDALFNLLF